MQPVGSLQVARYGHLNLMGIGGSGLNKSDQRRARVVGCPDPGHVETPLLEDPKPERLPASARSQRLARPNLNLPVRRKSLFSN